MSTDINNSNTSKPPAWDGIEVPDGWGLNETGVYKINPNLDGSESWSKTRSFAPVWVEGRVFIQESQEWGRTVAFYDHDGNVRRMTVADSLLYEEEPELMQAFVSLGLDLANPWNSGLAGYLFDFKPKHRMATDSGSS